MTYQTIVLQPTLTSKNQGESTRLERWFSQAKSKVSNWIQLSSRLDSSEFFKLISQVKVSFQVSKHRIKQIQRTWTCRVSCTLQEPSLCRCKPVRSIRKRITLPAVMDQFGLGCPTGSTKSYMQRVEVIRPRVCHFRMRCLLVILVHIFMPKIKINTQSTSFCYEFQQQT